MRVLVADDDLISGSYMLELMSDYGDCDITANGYEAVEAFKCALDSGERYDLVCMDIVMPTVDGYEALKYIREIEKNYNIPEENAAKIIMTTALNQRRNVIKAFQLGCNAYAGKPIDGNKFINELIKLELLGSHE